jgi:hypothetical protein
MNNNILKGRKNIKIEVFGILLTISIVFFVGKFLLFYTYFISTIDKPHDVPKWEADVRPIQSEKQVREQLSKIKQNNKKIKNPFSDAKFITIPGLRGAWSISSKTNKAGFGTDWIPQGVTQSDKYYFISMYDGDYQYNSIIIQINKETGHYIKTLILNSRAHVGGIYFDMDHKHLLWSDDQKSGGGISYVTQKDLDKYQAKVQQAPIKSTRIKWELSSRTSAITFYDHQMIVAKYGKKIKERSVITVPLDINGLPQSITKQNIITWSKDIKLGSSEYDTFEKFIFLLLNKRVINSYNQAWDRIQGLAITNTGFTLFSQSNGNSYGKVWAQNVSGDVWSKLKYTEPRKGIKVINVPKSIEEISLDSQSQLLTLTFESGAKKYRKHDLLFGSKNFMDRLVIIPLKVLDIR